MQSRNMIFRKDPGQKYYIHHIRIFYWAALLVFSALQCTSDPVNPPDMITVNFPLGQKAVYAIGYYTDSGDTVEAWHIRIASFFFDSSYTSGDTVYMTGTYERLEPDYGGQSESGRILISYTDKWVFFQNSEIFDAGIDLMKPLTGFKVDTTRLPTDEYSYFSVFPRVLVQDQTSAVYRPGNEGIDWGYAGVYRQFDVGEPAVWDDLYGSDAGFEVSVTHTLLGFTSNYDLIIDQHGIVNSQSAEWMYLRTENGDLIDSVLTYRVNRRIEDYADPALIKDLSDYAAIVQVNGLKYIKP
jgi:hypothetical protein